MSKKNEKQEILKNLLEEFNKKIACYVLNPDKITGDNEIKKELCSIFEKIILKACEERKSHADSLFGSKKSETTFSTKTHSAKKLIQYLYSPEAKKVREVLSELMSEKFPNSELASFSLSLQKYMKDAINASSKASVAEVTASSSAPSSDRKE